MTMIERVAGALLAQSSNMPVEPLAQSPSGRAWVDERWPTMVPIARAAIAAMREPTLEMRVAANDAEAEGPVGYGTMWQAMINAALAEQ